MNTYKIIGSILINILLTFATFAGTIDPSIPDSKYVEYGKKFPCVVKICGVEKNGDKFCASSIIIDDHHILTAAHVVGDCDKCFIVTDSDDTYLISKIIIHKDFDKNFGMGDIALGYSESNFDLPFYPKLYVNGDEVGKTCAIAGFGLTGNFNTGAITSDKNRRAGSNVVDRIYQDLLICDPSRNSSGEHTILEFFIASGDSGGGLFIDGKLAGINSCIIASGRSPKSKYNEESGHTRISKFIDWINDNKTKVD